MSLIEVRPAAGQVLGVIGWSGSGKTTLLEYLVGRLAAEGLRVNVIKHSHHDIVLEPPHKDSARLRQAGAGEVMIASPYRFAIMHELRGATEPKIPELLAKMSRVDLVLIEGFKREPHRKIEVHRAANGKPPLFPDDPGIVGIASDTRLETRLPTVHLDDIPAIAAMMQDAALDIADVLASGA